MILCGIILGACMLTAAHGLSLWDEAHYRPCPNLQPVTDLDISELNGKWHAILTIVDSAGGDDYEESPVCLTGELVQVEGGPDAKAFKREVALPPQHRNATLHQMWTLRSPAARDPTAVVHITSTLVRPGVWFLHTPLDGKVKATIYGYEKDKYMAVCGCGWRDGRLVHLWTSAVSRDGKLTSLARHVVATVLQPQPHQPKPASRLVSWNTQCSQPH